VGAIALAAAAGCGPTVLDTSSPDHLRESLTALREPLTGIDLERFDGALEYLVGGVSPDSVDPTNADKLLALFRPLAGRTAEGIVAEATFQRVREVRSAVTWMEGWRDATEPARRELSRFTFGEAVVFKRHRGYLEWPLIEVRVHNGTDHTISLIRFRASLLSPEGDAPLLVEEFDQLALGGLQPQANDLWRIEPEQRGWIQLVDPHPDLVFTLETMRLVAPGGRVLATTDWGAVEENTLATFLDTLQKIRTSGRLCLDLPPRASGPLGTVAPDRSVTIAGRSDVSGADRHR